MNFTSVVFILVLLRTNHDVVAEKTLRGQQAARRDHEYENSISTSKEIADDGNSGSANRVLSSGTSCYGPYQKSNTIVVSGGPRETNFTETIDPCTYHQCTYYDSFVKFTTKLTEFGFGANEAHKHERIVLYKDFPGGVAMEGNGLAEIGLFPNGTVFSPDYPTIPKLDSYKVGDKFRFEVNPTNDTIVLYKNGNANGTTFQADNETSFYVGIWFFEDETSVVLSCPSAPSPVQAPTPIPTRAPTPAPAVNANPGGGSGSGM